jgi:hypothetical protein
MTYRSLLSLSLSTLSACSLLDPKVGPDQAACADQADGSGNSGYAPAAPTATSATCGADAGSPCDDCESVHCCETRLACYGDLVCGCADKTLDGCLEDAQGDASIVGCWEAFSAAGRIAQARLACERAWCQDVCGVPNL